MRVAQFGDVSVQGSVLTNATCLYTLSATRVMLLHVLLGAR